MASATVAETNPLNGVLPMEDWAKTPAFLNCTEKQQKFLKTYAETGDAAAASRAAYDTENPKSLRDLAYQALRSPNVQAAIRLFQGVTDQQAVLSDLTKRLANHEKITVAEIEALKILVNSPIWSVGLDRAGKLVGEDAEAEGAEPKRQRKDALPKIIETGKTKLDVNNPPISSEPNHGQHESQKYKW